MRSTPCLRRRATDSAVQPSSSSPSSWRRPSLRACATIPADTGQSAAVAVELGVAFGGELLAQVGSDARPYLLAGGVEDAELFFGEVMVDHAGKFLDSLVEGSGIGSLQLENGEECLMPLGVLLLPVLGLMLSDCVRAAQLR